MSSGLRALPAKVELFLESAGFDRAPWLAVAFAVGIGLWFGLANSGQWLALIAACLASSVLSFGLLRQSGGYPYLRQSAGLLALTLAAGCLTVWAKSSLVGVPGIARPTIGTFSGEVLRREEQPAEERARLVLQVRDPETGNPIRIRVNVRLADDGAGAGEGDQVRVKARLMPPAPPTLPGSYNFARTAWFQGIAATGSALGPVEVLRRSDAPGGLDRAQRLLASHVRSRIAGSAGGIAAAFASGDRGGIAEADEQAMRDSGLTHLLSVSGLHVGAVVAGSYALAIRLFALFPWLALRVRLPLLAAGTGAASAIGYTLLTGAEVPTVRSCAGAMLVLLALALGREPLSLRMLAVAAGLVMLLWPEAVVGPSFQMSFASVLAIVALHGSGPVRGFLAHREEGWWRRRGRMLVMLVATGLVIELALMPVAFYHFHRAGIYGALANTIAIPLTTFVSMPLIALALLLDVVGAGAPAWWLAGKSLEFLLVIAHWTSARPGAVHHLPTIGTASFGLFVAGALWLALWRGRMRLLGLVPASLAAISLAWLETPDLLITGDGRNLGITGETGEKLLVLREGKSSYTRDSLTEIAGMAGDVTPLAGWQGASCTSEFCVADLNRGGRQWRLLIARGKQPVAERELAAACDLSDIVIAERWLPRSCIPRVLKADRNLLERTGGMALYLTSGRIRTVAEGEGQHGWWRGGNPPDRLTKAVAGQSQGAETLPAAAATPAATNAVSVIAPQ